MSNQIPKLNLEKFAHGYKSFYDATINILTEAESHGALSYLLTNDINSQYKYSEQGINNHPIMIYLKKNYLTGDQEKFLSFFNEVLPNVIRYIKIEEWEVNRINGNLKFFVNSLIDLLLQSSNQNVFNLDFYYDKQTQNFRRKLDEVNIELINKNDSSLDGDNKIRYQECVSDFLSYKRDTTIEGKLFYNESLNKLKKVIENTLQNNYKRTDGTFPKIHEKKQLSNIIFNNNNLDFETFIDYVIKNIHHEDGGQPKNFTEKEYIYLWLELNSILYLLNRYSEEKV